MSIAEKRIQLIKTLTDKVMEEDPINGIIVSIIGDLVLDLLLSQERIASALEMIAGTRVREEN